jgi:hypothetical protein
MLDTLCVLVTGDHAQSEVEQEDTAAIALDKVLADFNIVVTRLTRRMPKG